MSQPGFMPDRTGAVIAVAIAVLATAAASCGAGAGTEATDQAAVLTSAQMQINGVGQGMTESEVRAVLGPPSARIIPFYAFMSEDSMVLWRYPGLRVEFVDQVVDRLVCTARCATSDSLGIGDSVAKVLRTYGRPETLARPFGGLLIYRHAEVPCTMTFTVQRRLIGRIEVACEEEE
jgi:hypothetical protein